MNSWIYLSIAIVFEVAGTSCMKLSNGLTELWPSIGLFSFYAVAFICLTYALRTIDMSIAYAIWAGAGVALITILDLLIFKTQLGPFKLLALGLILVGTIMLKMLSA